MKKLAGNAWQYLPFKGKRKKMSREDALKALPVRNQVLRWFREDGEVKVFIPRKKSRFGEIVGRFFKLPDEKKLILDRVGSDVWEMCDGYHTVEHILEHIQRRHKLARREAEVSAGAYLKILSDRRLIGLMSADKKESKKAKCKRKVKG